MITMNAVHKISNDNASYTLYFCLDSSVCSSKLFIEFGNMKNKIKIDH